jgi:hypothetical protein
MTEWTDPMVLPDGYGLLYIPEDFPEPKKGEYLTASGGWCAPIETTTATATTIWSSSSGWSLPELKATRGKIEFTRSDDA